jgi:uncharacterized membrane protein
MTHFLTQTKTSQLKNNKYLLDDQTRSNFKHHPLQPSLQTKTLLSYFKERKRKKERKREREEDKGKDPETIALPTRYSICILQSYHFPRLSIMIRSNTPTLLLVLALTAIRVESFSSSQCSSSSSFLLAGPQRRPSPLTTVGLPHPSANNNNNNSNSKKQRSTSSTSSVLFLGDKNDDTAATAAFADVARPDPSVLLSAQDSNIQKGGVLAIGTGVLAGTYLIVQVLDGLDGLSGGFLETFLDFTVPLPLGLLYAALGVTHFFYKDGYAAIVPPPGTWGGLWQVPAPGAEKLGLRYEDYHVYWTGIAELGGGLLLALAGLNDVVPIQIPAVLLFLLTLAITPANMYMFTHDTQLSFAPPFAYPEGHIFRGVMQCILLSLFWFLAVH